MWQWAQITWLSLTLLNVVCAIACWRLASRSSRITKRMRDLETTTADLESSFDSLLESHKRLRSRAGMREIRERESHPKVETKAEIRRRLFGAAAGPAFAKIQQGIGNADS